MEKENLITEIDICEEARDNFLTYSAEVLTDRAIPTAEDGLLSGQRKILWTMEDYLKMNNKSKTKKSNGIIGATLQTSYFHGDAACYGSYCKMAQPYLMRYPLIQGKGNLGSQEENGMEAASRYTEGKPSVYTDLMMNDFKKNVVPLKETYNNEFMEPVVLPSLFPNAICNGRQAIGISMSHNSAPNNLTEACNAILRYLRQGALTIDELLEEMPGPDFPIECTVINKKDVKEAYKTGKSKVSLKIRGNYTIDGQTITFTSIPYRTYRKKIKEQIEKNIDKLSELIDDFDDFSQLGNNKLIFKVKSGIDPVAAVNALFTTTDLQTTLSYNMNFIVNGTPKLCSMLDLVKFYVEHQENVLVKATEYDLEKAKARVHILEGLLKALDVIDEVVAKIRASADRASARTALINFLSIDEVQANAILDMKLVRLTHLDKQELVDEKKDLEDKIAFWEKIINDKVTRDDVLIERVTKLRDTYGDARRTQLCDIEIPKAKKEAPIVIPEDVVIMINNNGIIKRIPRKSFRAQKRNTVGMKTHGDIIAFSTKTNTVDTLMVFSSKGKMYRVGVDAIPEGTNSGGGVYLSSLIETEADERPMAYTTLSRDTDKKYIFFATKNGIIKKVPLSEYDKMKRTGIIALNLKEGDELAAVTFINQEEMMLVTKNGMVIRFATAGMPISSRIAQGVKGMNVSEDDEVIAALPIGPAVNSLALVSIGGLGKQTKLTEFTAQNRGGKGVSCYKGTIIGANLINDDDNILISGDKSSIVVSATDFPSLGRSSNGNIMLKNNTSVISVSKI